MFNYKYLVRQEPIYVYFNIVLLFEFNVKTSVQFDEGAPLLPNFS